MPDQELCTHARWNSDSNIAGVIEMETASSGVKMKEPKLFLEKYTSNTQ